MRPPARPRTTPRQASPGPTTGATPARAPARKQAASSARRPSTGVATAPTGTPSTAASGRRGAARAGAARTGATAVVPAGQDVPPRVSTAMADRLAERTAMRRHRTWRRVLAWVLSLALVVGAAVAALGSPLLALEPAEVAVTGADEYVDEAAVREIVEAPAGTPLPRLDTVSLREEVLDLRGVKDVRIARAWPHGLAVELTPRVPVAAVPDGDELALLDSAGVRVATRPEAPKGLPQVDVPLDDALALQAALHVLAALPAKLSAQVEHVSADTQDAVETVLEDGTTVRWGGSSDLPLKVETVQTLRTLDGDARTIDVSSPELPVTR
ncbi:FtsQ-type POTRA domain-containing protein [Isoptericola sp. 4D.3]|uniref:FtsQ-type POTRA domain-containing protein n=1 Tax=Isoptericola peretonis TaxID=2918523 RepID=A0ABT0J7T7_9MICO|nr:FtsQ-type POTRA domain-containing protein [Isoptericola sp. 4D.3]